MIPYDFLKAIANEHGVSKAELEVVALAMEGQSTNAIAKTLDISEHAVRKRLSEVYK
ncbi:MAG: LuxR family transcriptional regulator, partial [Moorea sp. SIO4A3]|nr:LuxR family transcriptional regulator [Moorena sp. SIO4A3]